MTTMTTMMTSLRLRLRLYDYDYDYSYSHSCSYSHSYPDAHFDASTPLCSFLPSSPSTTLVVPVANYIAYSITVVYRYSSQDAWLFKHALATQAAPDLRLCLRLISQAST